MKRVLLLPVAIAGALVAHWFWPHALWNLCISWPWASPIVATLGGRSSISTPTPGYVCVWFGIALLIISLLFICRKMAFHSKNFFMTGRFQELFAVCRTTGITSVTAGLTIINSSQSFVGSRIEFMKHRAHVPCLTGVQLDTNSGHAFGIFMPAIGTLQPSASG